VITLGIDLASLPIRTAACTIEWADGRARVLDIACGQDDDALLERIGGADKAGLDVPFGWPDAFADAVARFHAGGRWPDASVVALRYRETDRVAAARTGRWPLSVSTDLIGVPTFRAARLLTRLAEGGEAIDRSGAGRLVETYPAAALRIWGFASTGYKRREGLAGRGALLAALCARTRGWLELDAAGRRSCGHSDDALDALVAALIARAAALGLCEPVPSEQTARAAREGWIALPTPGSLDALAAGAPASSDRQVRRLSPAGESRPGSARRTSATSTHRRP
jgi:hypothetical protein